jgi:hypothetical protein
MSVAERQRHGQENGEGRADYVECVRHPEHLYQEPGEKRAYETNDQVEEFTVVENAVLTVLRKREIERGGVRKG